MERQNTSIVDGQNANDELNQPEPYIDHMTLALAPVRASDAESYFRRKLGDIEETTAPFGLRHGLGENSQAEEAYQDFETGFSQRVRELARRLSVNQAALFHAAWALIVARTSGRDDVVYGAMLHNGAGEPRIVGTLRSTLPLRLSLQRVTAKELVEQTHLGLIELLSYDQFSLLSAQRCSGLAESEPLFTTIFSYNPNPHQDDGRSGASGIQVLAVQERTNYPIAVFVVDQAQVFSVTARTDRRVDPVRVLRYVRTAMQSLVQALEQDPQTPAMSLSTLPEDERRQVLELFNSTYQPYSPHRMIHDLFEEQARRTPDAVAVAQGGRLLKYAELDARASQLARYLRQRGIGPDRLVGLCIERSFEMLVGILGILKSGGAYVPLDPNYPVDRLRHMLTDAELDVVLTQASLLKVLPPSQAELISLDAQWQSIVQFDTDSTAANSEQISPNNLVYVIYTSGSTGVPKGTAMEHHSVVNLIEWHRSEFGDGAGQRVLQFAALSFDVAFQEVFSTLCTGGTLVLLDERTRRDPRALTELLIDMGVNRLFMTPLMLQSLAEYLESVSTVPDRLRDVIVAGEQLRITQAVTNLFRRIVGCRLHNHYGPTESHVVTAATLQGNPELWPRLPPIGRPISNTQIYVLNSHGQPVPSGVPGEIYIGGVGVARGYLRRPELTSERFIKDPFSSHPQARLYKTGDLGQWCADGNIEYLGRNDHQVKIRGFRIELGEIETQLLRHPRIKEAVVLAREDEPGEKRLVAYVTCRDSSIGDSALSVEAFRSHLQSALPDYMVPSAFVVLESMPLTANGKLDRRALPAPQLDAYGTRKYEAPRGEIEELLAGLWKTLLHVERVGRQDDFFELGGHSLLGNELIVQIANLYKVEIPFTALFQYPTIGQLAQFVEELRGASA
jgi:amino acid adenylation domain-containing protein